MRLMWQVKIKAQRQAITTSQKKMYCLPLYFGCPSVEHVEQEGGLTKKNGKKKFQKTQYTDLSAGLRVNGPLCYCYL